MKLKKKINLLQEYIDKDVILEDSEIIPINEETEAYQKGVAKGKAFQAAVVLAVVVFIAIRRAKARLKTKQAYYKKQKPKREILVAEKRIVTKRFSAQQAEDIKGLVGKLQDKVKTEVKKKKAAYAAKAKKTQSELQGDKTLANLDKIRDEKLKKVEDAAKEKLKQMQDKEQLTLDRKIEDWDRKWKKVQEKLDPSELFNKIAGKKGLGGVVATWEQWKIDEDRKIYDKTLKYELKQLREFVEKDEDIKAIMEDRAERKKKMEEEWKEQGLSIEERLKKAEALEKELEEEEGELKNEFPDLPDAKEARATLDEALSSWGITYEAISSAESITSTQKEELQDLAKEAGKAMTGMTDKYYEAITGGKDYSELKEADKEHKDALDKGQKEFLGKVTISATEEEITKIKEELDDAVKELNDVKGVDEPDEKDILSAELTVLQKKESLATAEGNEKARKTLVQSIEDKEKEIEEYKEPEETEETEKDNNSYNMKVTKRLKSLNEWRSVFENEPQPQEAPRPNDRNKVEVDVKEPTPDLSSEIDIILNKLKDLENNLEEDLKIIKREELNEAGAAAVGGAAVDFIKDFMKSRKVKSSQVKANGIKMQKAKADIQKGEVEPAKKEKLKKQIDKFKESIDKIEGTIDQMADGPMSKRVKNTYRIQGNMEVAKVLAKGGRDNKKQIASLNKKLKDEVAATKKLADENKDAIAKMKKDQAAKKDGEAPKKEPEAKKEAPKKEPKKDKKKDIEDKANKAMDKEKADAKAAGEKAKADKKAKDTEKPKTGKDRKVDIDDAPKPPSKEKQKAAADKINKQSDKKIKAAGDDQKKSIKDTEAGMKKQNKDTMKKGQKDIDNMKKGFDKINKDSAKKKEDPIKKDDKEEKPKKKKSKGKSKIKV